VYSFFEGREDPSFYMNAIVGALPEGWRIRRWCAGRKDSVYAVFAAMDPLRFDPHAVIFFVDRDLSDLFGESYPKATNIYVTDHYSIENEMVNLEMLERILAEMNGFHNVAEVDLHKTLAAFEAARVSFCRHVAGVMAWSLLCRMKDHARPSMNNIDMRELFSVENGVLVVKGAADVRTVADHCESKCNVKTSATNAELEQARATIGNAQPYYRHIRGKYLLWFLLEFAESVWRDCRHHFPGMGRQPKRHVQLGQNNAMEILGPRARIPGSLRTFLDATIGTYARA